MLCCKVGVAFGSVALERGVRMSTLKKNKLGGISEKDNTEVTLKTAVSLKQALLGLGSTFIKGSLLIVSTLLFLTNEGLSRVGYLSFV